MIYRLKSKHRMTFFFARTHPRLHPAQLILGLLPFFIASGRCSKPRWAYSPEAAVAEIVRLHTPPKKSEALSSYAAALTNRAAITAQRIQARQKQPTRAAESHVRARDADAGS